MIELSDIRKSYDSLEVVKAVCRQGGSLVDSGAERGWEIHVASYNGHARPPRQRQGGV